MLRINSIRRVQISFSKRITVQNLANQHHVYACSILFLVMRLSYEIGDTRRTINVSLYFFLFCEMFFTVLLHTTLPYLCLASYCIINGTFANLEAI